MKNSVRFLIIIVISLIAFSCSEKRETLKVTTHPAAWNDTSSDQFHGKAVLEVGTQSCETCHGTNFSGGESGVACADCHDLFPHPTGFADLSSPSFHGNYIKQELNWNLEQCQSCHGTDFSGGSTGSSCNVCHTGPGGPEACNTCHGSQTNIAPPKDLSGNVSRSFRGVGAHQDHVTETDVSNGFTCSVCHVSVNGFNDPNHIDNQTGANVIFGNLATQNGLLNTQWDRDVSACGNVYCHGHFVFEKAASANPYAYAASEITGNPTGMSWVQTSSTGGDNCIMCHGLPPQGHIAVSSGNCATCHGSVVNADGKIIDKTKHINGLIDLN